LTTRTFFRHFADKREVLFAYDAQIPAFVSALLGGPPLSEILHETLNALTALAVSPAESAAVRD